MNAHELEPLPDDLVALLATERARPELPEDVRAQLLSSIEATIGAGSIPPGEGGASGGAGGSAEGAQAAGAAGAAGAVGLASVLTKGLFAHPFAVALTTFVLGGVTGVALAISLRPAPQIVTIVATAPDALAGVAPPQLPEPTRTPIANEVAQAPTVAATAAPSSDREPRGVSAPSLDTPAPGRDVDLGAERALLDTARAAVASGQGGAALEVLARHQREFPRARLGEEREVLTIQALMASGRTSEAKARASRFRKANPRSMMIRAIDTVVGENP